MGSKFEGDTPQRILSDNVMGNSVLSGITVDNLFTRWYRLLWSGSPYTGWHTFTLYSHTTPSLSTPKSANTVESELMRRWVSL